MPTGFTGSEEPMAWPGIDHWIGGPHERELLPMSWEELATLAGAGWEIGGSHAHAPHLTELDDATLAEELRASRHDCESRLGLPCRSFAYPFSDEDERVVKATGEAGYSAAGHAARVLRAGIVTAALAPGGHLLADDATPIPRQDLPLGLATARRQGLAGSPNRLEGRDAARGMVRRTPPG